MGAYLPCWRARREKAAGSSAELRVLVTHSNGGHMKTSEKGVQAC